MRGRLVLFTLLRGRAELALAEVLTRRNFISGILKAFNELMYYSSRMASFLSRLEKTHSSCDGIRDKGPLTIRRVRKRCLVQGEWLSSRSM